MSRLPSVIFLVVGLCCVATHFVFGQDKVLPPSMAGIDDALKPFIEQGRASGVVVLVARDGRIVHLSAIGNQDIEAGKAMTPSNLFAIASMTKPITATAIMILQDEGKLSIDDKVSKYLPEFAAVKLVGEESPRREITIRDLMTHTAGLSGSQVFGGSLADAVSELATRPLAFEPGARWQYSPGLNVAGRIVEVVAGEPLEEFLQQRILTPLQMDHTTFYPDAKLRQRLAKIYQPGKEEGKLEAVDNHITDYSKENGPNPSGGLVSNARDLFRFYQMVLDGGTFRGTRVLSEEAVSQMTSPQTGELETGFTPGNCWGLGWCVVREPQGVTAAVSKGTFGHGGAFGTQGWVDPQTNTIYVLLMQRTKFGNSDASEIREAFQKAAAESLADDRRPAGQRIAVPATAE